MKLDHYQYKVLDFDGTICKLIVDWKGLKNELNQSFNIEKSSTFKLMDILNEIFMRGEKEKDLALNIIKSYEQPEGIPIFEELNLSLINSCDSFYVISNNLHSTVSSVLNIAGLSSKCKLIIGIDDTFKPKPNETSFLKLTNFVGDLDERKYIYIGDTEVDEKFAEKVKVDFCHIKKIAK